MEAGWLFYPGHKHTFLDPSEMAFWTYFKGNWVSVVGGGVFKRRVGVRGVEHLISATRHPSVLDVLASHEGRVLDDLAKGVTGSNLVGG